jgi:uncharacterized protein YbjT (DUF2867 family)
LAHGKKVRALVRNRDKAAHWANRGVELVDGDWNDSKAIEHALKGVEGAFVMLPAVWAPSPDFKEARVVIANYVETLISALGVGDSRGHGGFVFDRLFQPLLLRHAYKDKGRQEAAIRASLLDWVIVRPAMLTNDPARGSVRATVDLAGVNGGKVARADVTRFVVEQLTTNTWLKRTPVLLW